MTHYQRKQRRRTTRGGKVRNFVLISAGVVFAAVAIALIAVVGYVISIAATTPNIDELKPFNKGTTSSVFAANGRLLGYVRSDIVRQPILESDIPQDVRSATVAIEDSRFYKHHGVDFEGIVRAAVKNIENHKTVQGGSTITMQLVRALYSVRSQCFGRSSASSEAGVASRSLRLRSGRGAFRDGARSGCVVSVEAP